MSRVAATGILGCDYTRKIGELKADFLSPLAAILVILTDAG
jgi:hypothetical protein